MSAIYDIPANRLDGTPGSLRDFAGKVVLVVNVASKCGLTPQYDALQKLYAAERERGLIIAGFPSNDFMGQEPGTSDEIATFCSTNYGVDFPLFEKISVAGESAHPLYRALMDAQPNATKKSDDFRKRLEGFGHKPPSESAILWNFEKFLIGRDGNVVARFAPDVAPDDPLVRDAIEKELAKPA